MMALIVDDSAAMRRIQQKALESLGWQVKAASSGEEALAALEGLPECVLLLTDWHMPGMDGLQLVSAVRKDPRYSKLRIVMVTSDAVLDSVEAALSAGANDFLMKPFTTEVLAERVAEVMRG
ncbi:MAG: response regulator [Deltaproteobacteria bacterium]|nr:response regulator [Deltaproteobacteria bacterium]